MNGSREFPIIHDPECARRAGHRVRASAKLLAAMCTIAIVAPTLMARGQEWPVPPAGAMRADNGQPAESMWEEDAEETLHLVPGTAHQLLTDEEWHQHREHARELDGEQRERYMADWRQEIIGRAHERGIPIPGQRPSANAPANAGPPMAPEALGPDDPMEAPGRGAAGIPREPAPTPDGKALPDPPRFPRD